MPVSFKGSVLFSGLCGVFMCITHTYTSVVCTHACWCVHAGGCEDQRSVSGVSLQELFTLFLRQGLMLAWSSAVRLGSGP